MGLSIHKHKWLECLQGNSLFQWMHICFQIYFAQNGYSNKGNSSRLHRQSLHVGARDRGYPSRLYTWPPSAICIKIRNNCEPWGSRLVRGGFCVIFGNVISPDCKTLASCVPGLNFRGLNNCSAVHGSPQRRRTPTATSDRGRPGPPPPAEPEDTGRSLTLSPQVPRRLHGPHVRPRSQSLPPSLARGRTGLQSKPRTRRHHLSPCSPRAAAPSWRLRPRFPGNSEACELDAGFDFSAYTGVSGSTGPRGPPWWEQWRR